jgi:hypothetical protein
MEEMAKSTMSDMDTDQVGNEVAGMLNNEHHPWPKELRDVVWMERVRLRQKMKIQMKRVYESFEVKYGDRFRTWFRNLASNKSTSTAGTESLHRFVTRRFQLPRQEIVESIIRDKYNIHNAYSNVLQVVLEQVANFSQTEYPADAPANLQVGDSHAATEHFFETTFLVYNRRCGFTLNVGALVDRVTDTWQSDNVELFLQHLQSSAGPKLLHRGPSKARSGIQREHESDSENDGDADGAPESNNAAVAMTPAARIGSFQGDRRLLRLMIARFWYEQLQHLFLVDLANAGELTCIEINPTGVTPLTLSEELQTPSIRPATSGPIS